MFLLNNLLWRSASVGATLYRAPTSTFSREREAKDIGAQDVAGNKKSQQRGWHLDTLPQYYPWNSVPRNEQIVKGNVWENLLLYEAGRVRAVGVW